MITEVFFVNNREVMSANGHANFPYIFATEGNIAQINIPVSSDRSFNAPLPTFEHYEEGNQEMFDDYNKDVLVITRCVSVQSTQVERIPSQLEVKTIKVLDIVP